MATINANAFFGCLIAERQFEDYCYNIDEHDGDNIAGYCFRV